MEEIRTQLLLALPTTIASTSSPRAAGDDGGATNLRGDLFTSFDRLAHQARAAESSGFDGVVLPFDARGEDTIIAATAIARRTLRIRVVPEIVSSLSSPVYAAKLSVTFQRFSGDRMGWLIDVDSAGAGPAYGDQTSSADRLARHREFVRIARAVFSPGSVDVAGTFFSVTGGGFAGPLAERPFPVVTVAGSSSGSLQLAAEVGDRHLFSAADDGDLGHQIHRLRSLAESRGRHVAAALAVTVVARETEDEARNAAHARRSPAPGRTLVGSYEQVADRLLALARLGVGEFVLDLQPAIDEAHRFGHCVRPLLVDRGVAARLAAGSTAAGHVTSGARAS